MTPEVKEKLMSELVIKCGEILNKNPDNRCCKYVMDYLSTAEGKSLSKEGKINSFAFSKHEAHKRTIMVKATTAISTNHFPTLSDYMVFYKCIKTGIDNPDSGLGCYAMTTTDYTKFSGFFDKVIRDYHGDSSGMKKHETSWDTGDANYDVKKLGIEEISMRVRVGRNLTGFNLPGRMEKSERITFEQKMLPAFDQLKERYGGQVYSLTPDFGNDGENPNLITQDEYKELVDAHVMFKDMAADPYLNSAGISNDWPFGRGCWQSEDKMRIIWFGEEDQLRIMCMKKGTNLLEVFSNLNEMLHTVESMEGIDFAKDENYGYVTSCPSNLGTGMRASVHLKIPNLTADGTDEKAKQVCRPLGLSLRGTGGEHTPIGADGTVDISPSARLFVKESDIINKLYEGIEKLMAVECR